MHFSERYATAKKHRTSYAKKRAGVLVTLFFLVCILIVASLWISWWRVKTIIIDGEVDHEAAIRVVERIIRQRTAFVIPEDNYLFVPSQKIIEAFKDTMTGIAFVEQRFPDQLHIVFPQWKPVLGACFNEIRCFYVNAEGVIFTQAPDTSDGTLPRIFLTSSTTIRLGDTILTAHDVAFLMHMTQALQNHNIAITRIDVTSPIKDLPISYGEYDTRTKEGWHILTHALTDQDQTTRDLFQLLNARVKKRSLLSYIDLRFPNKAFFKYGSAPAPVPSSIITGSSSPVEATSTFPQVQ